MPSIIEIVVGPYFNEWVTGNRVSSQWIGAARGSTFRPAVFLHDGFVLTMFLALGALTSTALTWQTWSSAARGKWLYLAATCVLVLLILASKSLGSIALSGVGLACLLIACFACRPLTTPVLFRTCYYRYTVVLVACLAPVYVTARLGGVLPTKLVNVAANKLVAADRAKSLIYRLKAEDIVMERMSGHWLFGFGDFNRWIQGHKVLALDGFWLFTLTRTGVLGVACWLAMVLAPIIVWLRSMQLVADRPIVVALVVFVAISMIDSMFNYFGSPPQMLAIGAIAGVLQAPKTLHASSLTHFRLFF